MISLHEISDLSAIGNLKMQYLNSLVAPMDGMWEVGFTNAAPHWEMRVDGVRAGYYAANDKGTLLQFYVQPAYAHHGQAMFDHVIAQETLTGAVVSTIDPTCLSLCLDVHKKITVHTYLYESTTEVLPAHPEAEGVELRLVAAPELERIIVFQQACLGGEADLSDWLRVYSSNLIEKKALYVLCRDDEWLGLGEYRKSDSQQGIADLGMMVTPAHRGKGWATYILSSLSVQCKAAGLHAICSTTVDNVGSQKAIVRSGFRSRHRIMDVSF